MYHKFSTGSAQWAVSPDWSVCASVPDVIAMTSFIRTVAGVLGEIGPTEINILVRVALNRKPSNRSVKQLTQTVLLAAIAGEEGLEVAEYPKFRLKRALGAANLPTHGYARAALIALDGNKGTLSLSALAQHYKRESKSAARCPEYWMYCALEEQLAGVVSKTGQLRIRLAQATEPPGLCTKTPLEEQPIGPRIDEKSWETLLANRPDFLEEGLTLFQRQYRIPVGRIDLLFVDRNRNYVVVEIKRPAADHREVVGQITTYMGWVRKHIAGSGQTVRGIIVVGKKSQHLEYSLDLLPDVTFRTFL